MLTHDSVNLDITVISHNVTISLLAPNPTAPHYNNHKRISVTGQQQHRNHVAINGCSYSVPISSLFSMLHSCPMTLELTKLQATEIANLCWTRTQWKSFLVDKSNLLKYQAFSQDITTLQIFTALSSAQLANSRVLSLTTDSLGTLYGRNFNLFTVR